MFTFNVMFCLMYMSVWLYVCVYTVCVQCP